MVSYFPIKSISPTRWAVSRASAALSSSSRDAARRPKLRVMSRSFWEKARGAPFAPAPGFRHLKRWRLSSRFSN
eukprot:6556831-Pyramimonas_sp.AAC.1